MSASCAFCGSTQPMTREHVFGQWVSKTGLDLSPVRHKAGPLNRLPRDMGEQPPYRQKVKNFCSTCNNGWMSRLEGTAQRVLTPMILGEPGTIAFEDRAAIAMWIQKTALTAMLVSSQEQRDGGYGLPASEYAALYEQRERMQPLDASRFWVGRYAEADGFSGVRVTPLAIRAPGTPESDVPHGYVMTIVLGQLVLQGLRFTAPITDFDVTSELGMPQLWPSRAPLTWPAGIACTQSVFLPFADGKMLRPGPKHLRLHPWTTAANVPQSAIVGDRVEVPALCGKHVVDYPIVLIEEAFQGTFYAFVAACECATYLMQTEFDGTHCKAAGEADWVTEMYEALPGDKGYIPDEGGRFDCKCLPRDMPDVYR
ncbi:hypothetical protein ACP3TD_11560 [Pseudarthrobacter sp. 1G09]|uniref:hypothetical protein n=1 Tax=Pseudarthrobacter sp. 1G09 TaxID=3416178 RepID=UPI003CEF38C0